MLWEAVNVMFFLKTAFLSMAAGGGWDPSVLFSAWACETTFDGEQSEFPFYCEHSWASAGVLTQPSSRRQDEKCRERTESCGDLASSWGGSLWSQSSFAGASSWTCMFLLTASESVCPMWPSGGLLGRDGCGSISHNRLNLKRDL